MIALATSEPSFSDDLGRYLTILTVVMVISAIIVPAAWALVRLGQQPSYRELIGDWCRTHGLRLVTLDRRWLWKGPFFLSPNSTTVFYVTVCDESGTEKHLWIRCGHWLFGMLVPKLLVEAAD